MQLHVAQLQFHPEFQYFSGHLQSLFPDLNLLFKLLLVGRLVEVGYEPDVFVIEVDAVFKVLDNVDIIGSLEDGSHKVHFRPCILHLQQFLLDALFLGGLVGDIFYHSHVFVQVQTDASVQIEPFLTEWDTYAQSRNNRLPMARHHSVNTEIHSQRNKLVESNNFLEN